jgi:hypothetical protein
MATFGLNDRTYSFDANLELSDNSVQYTATGFTQCRGADGIVDLGGNQGTSPKQQARIDAVAVCDVILLDATTTDEAYRMLILGSNDPGFANGKIFVLGELELAGGVLSVLGPGVAGVTGTAVIGRYEIPFCNQQAGVTYQYVKMFLVMTGTTPILSLEAFIAVLPEP